MNDRVRAQMSSEPADPSTGMAAYVVALDRGRWAAASPCEAGSAARTGMARTAAFHRRLESWLREQSLESEVAAIGEPMVFPLVTLTTTPKVAACIETLPEVEYVMRDSDDMFDALE